MNNLFDGLEAIMAGVVIPIILSTAATVVYVSKCGWHGIRHFFSCWCISCFMGVCAHWLLEHLQINSTLSALIISMSALLSHAILDILFHPKLRAAIIRRLNYEISTRFSNGNSKSREFDE